MLLTSMFSFSQMFSDHSVTNHIIIPLQNECFGGYTGISLSVHPYVCVSFFVQNASLCQSASGDIKSHLMTALILFVLDILSVNASIMTSLKFLLFGKELPISKTNPCYYLTAVFCLLKTM